MAQFDNDQQARGRASKTAEAIGCISRGRTAPDERRREHHLSSSSSSSSSSCSSCSSSASSQTFSDGGGANDDDDDELDRNGRSLLDRVRQINCQRGHYSGRLHRKHHTMQTQSKSEAAHCRPQQHCNGQLVPVRATATSATATAAAANGPVGLGEGQNNSRARGGQLSRQHSDGSAIGAQLMNVLRINDDLSSSSHARLFTSTDNNNENMLMGHPQELDARLTMSTGATSGAATIMNQPAAINYDHDHERAILSGGHAAPLLVVSPVAHHHHQDLYLNPANAGHQHAFNNGQQFGQYPMTETLMMVPTHHAPGPFYNPHHNHHHHHLQHATCANQLVAADGQQQQQQQLSYADLDEETARHQNERRQFQQQQSSGDTLPESVIRANEFLAVGDDQRHRAFYSRQQDYNDSNHLTTSMPQTSSLKHETNTTLTALNSSFDASVEQRAAHRQLGASTDSLNVALKELSSVTAEEIGSASGEGGRWKGHRNDTNQVQHHHHQQAELSAAGSEHVVVEQNARGSPTDMEEELKVCEWRDCGNTFLDMNEFVRHLEEKHVNLEPREKNRFFCLWHNCKRNNQEFNARYKLLIHMRVHSGEKPYFCQNNSCKKSFSRLENLKIHVRSHTGEKPYRCQYEHCPKSFTNSSDRIKHHKTHKDPKPYNCTHNGCTKRYTDPSSLRKHLRAHKRHSFGGSMDSSRESSTIATVANDQQYHSNASCSFSSARINPSHGQQTCSSPSAAAATAMSNELHYANQQHNNRNHYHHHHHQGDQHDQYEPYVETIQFVRQQPHQQVSGSELQQQQQHSNYLHADYDPNQEFANVLSDLNGTMREEIATTSGQEVETTYYVDASFERPYQHGPTQQQSTDHFETRGGHETGQSDSIRGPYCQQQTNQYLTPTPTDWNHRHQRQRVQPAAARNQMDSLRDRHQQLSKSWCGSGSLQSSGQQRQMPWTNTGRSQQQQAQFRQQQPRMVHSSQIESFASNSPSRMRRRVEFECVSPTTGNYETNTNWTGSRTTMNYDQQQQQQQQMDADEHYQNSDGQQQYDQNWPSQHSRGPNGQATGDNQQRQIHYQTRLQQHQPNQQHQPLTRRQQHAQLMRSMPANVNFYQSQSSSFEAS